MGQHAPQQYVPDRMPAAYMSAHNEHSDARARGAGTARAYARHLGAPHIGAPHIGAPHIGAPRIVARRPEGGGSLANQIPVAVQGRSNIVGAVCEVKRLRAAGGLAQLARRIAVPLGEVGQGRFERCRRLRTLLGRVHEQRDRRHGQSQPRFRAVRIERQRLPVTGHGLGRSAPLPQGIAEIAVRLRITWMN